MVEQMEIGDIIRGAGPRAPRYEILKVNNKSYTVRDQYDNIVRFRKDLPWYKVF